MHSDAGWYRPDVDGAPLLPVSSRSRADFELERCGMSPSANCGRGGRRSKRGCRPRAGLMLGVGPRPGQLSLVPVTETNVFGAHPRRDDGRADFRRARAILASGEGAGARPIDTTKQPVPRTRRRVA